MPPTSPQDRPISPPPVAAAPDREATSDADPHPTLAAPAKAHKEEKRLNRRFDRLEGALPGGIGNRLRGLRRPGLWMVRVPIALLMIVGGVLGFLPVLGLWMLPLGLLLLAVDLPFLKAPVARTMVRAERRWQTWRRERRKGSG